MVREEQCATEALEASYSKTSAVSLIAFARSIYFICRCLPFPELGGVHEIQLQPIPIKILIFFSLFLLNQISWLNLVETTNPKRTNFI